MGQKFNLVGVRQNGRAYAVILQSNKFLVLHFNIRRRFVSEDISCLVRTMEVYTYGNTFDVRN